MGLVLLDDSGGASSTVASTASGAWSPSTFVTSHMGLVTYWTCPCNNSYRNGAKMAVKTVDAALSSPLLPWPREACLEILFPV